MSAAQQSTQSPVARLGLSLLVGLSCSLLLLVLFAPRYWAWVAIDIPDEHAYPEVNRAVDVLKQLGTPFVEIESLSNRVIEWRLLVPLLATLLGLSRELLFCIAPLGCVGVLSAAFHLLRRETGRVGLALIGTLVVGASSWFFVSTGWLAYQDSWLVVGALGLLFARRLPTLITACVLTPWIDERFVLALPLLASSRWLATGRRDSGVLREALAITAATAPYLLLRLGALLSSDADTSGAYIERQLSWFAEMPGEERRRLLPGAWQSLRGAWLFVGLCALEPWLAGRRREAALLLAVLSFTVVLNLLAAGDFSRSASALVPLALLGLISSAKRSPATASTVATLALLLCSFTPARHVVSTFDIPIRGLRAERAEALEPPAGLNPKARAWRALAREEAGDLDGALSDLAAAVVLDDRAASPRLLRAQVLERAGRHAEARADFEAALLRAPPGSAEASAAQAALQRLASGR